MGIYIVISIIPRHVYKYNKSKLKVNYPVVTTKLPTPSSLENTHSTIIHPKGPRPPSSLCLILPLPQLHLPAPPHVRYPPQPTLGTRTQSTRPLQPRQLTRPKGSQYDSDIAIKHTGYGAIAPLCNVFIQPVKNPVPPSLPTFSCLGFVASAGHGVSPTTLQPAYVRTYINTQFPA